MSYLKDYVYDFLRNSLIYEERYYDRVYQNIEYQRLFKSLTSKI